MKKGYTLVELLGVIAVIVIVFFITVPMVFNIIENNQKRLYAESMKGILDAVKIAMQQDAYFDINPSGIDVNHNIVRVKHGDYISGTININEDDVLYVNMITDGTFCAMGTKRDMKVVRGECYLLDDTGPIIAGEEYIVTTNSIVVAINAIDEDSAVTGYQFSINNGPLSEISPSGTYTFSNLTHGVTHNLKIKVINKNNIETIISKDVGTTLIENPVCSLKTKGSTIAAIVDFKNNSLAKSYQVNTSAWQDYSSNSDLSVDFTSNGILKSRISDGFNVVYGNDCIINF